MKTIDNNLTEKQQKARKKVLDYFNKTSKHLFLEGNNFVKIIPFNYKDNWYYARLEFNGTKCRVEIKEIHYWNLRYYKDNLFQRTELKTERQPSISI